MLAACEIVHSLFDRYLSNRVQFTNMHLVNAQLNNSMWLLSGTLWPTPLPWLPVLNHTEPPVLRCKAAVDGLVATATVHHSWLLSNDLLHPLQHQLTSHMPLWSDMEPVDIISEWRNDWSSVSVVNGDLIEDPIILQDSVCQGNSSVL